MLHSIHEFLYENRGWVCLFTIPTGLIYGRILILGLISDFRRPKAPVSSTSLAGSPSAPLVVKPPMKLPSNSERVAAQQALKQHAKTEMLDVPTDPKTKTTSTEPVAQSVSQDAELRALTHRDGPNAATVTDVFSGAESDIVVKAPSAEIARQANRLEELGIGSEEAKAVPVETDAKHERLAELGLASAAAAEAPAPQKPPPPQLDTILARLDQVLSGEVKPAVEAAAPSSKKTEVPLWARADSFDEDVAKTPSEPKQLGLFDNETEK